MKKFAVTLAACLVAVSGAASAQTSNGLNASTSNAQIYDFNPQTLGPLLTSFGYASEMDSLFGQATLRVTDGNYTAGLMPTACDDSGKCVGLAMIAFFGEGGSLALNNQFNNNTFFAAVEQWDGVNVLERYLISDFGYSKASLEVDLAVYFSVVDQYAGHLNSSATEVSFETPEAPASGKIANLPAPATNGPGPHLLSKSDMRSIALQTFPDMVNEFNGFSNLIGE
jgi:hypothetical protein